MNDENTTISQPPNPSNLKGLLVLPKEIEEELALLRIDTSPLSLFNLYFYCYFMSDLLIYCSSE
jgi:hypothetical protein